MKMYNPSGDQVLVTKEQVPALLSAGWSKTAPVMKKDPEVENVTADSVDTEKVSKTPKKRITVKKE